MKLILALYPSYRGLGYVCVQMPQTLKDFGVLRVRPFSMGRMVKHVERFLEFHRPHIVILRDPENVPVNSPRIQKFTDAITTLAGEYKLSVFKYSREQIKDVFETFGARTKHEIAHKIIEWFPDLASRVPKMRAKYRPEYYHMETFDSLALAITHEYLSW
jgi:hypothetical protein